MVQSMALLLLAASAAGNVAFPEAVSDTSLAALRTRQLANIVRPLAAFKAPDDLRNRSLRFWLAL